MIAEERRKKKYDSEKLLCDNEKKIDRKTLKEKL